MDPALTWTILLLLSVMDISTATAPTELLEVNCEDPELELEQVPLPEGESLSFIVKRLDHKDYNFTWYWNHTQDVLLVPTDETAPLHSHGSALFILNATQEHSGCFLAWKEGFDQGHYFWVKVFPVNSSELLYTDVNNSDQNKLITCPNRLLQDCHQLNGNLSWYKDNVLLQGESDKSIRIINSQAADEGLYSCVCTWSHHQHQYLTSASRRLLNTSPINYAKTQILSPSVHEQLVEAGARLMLNCTVFCGTNVPESHCRAWWQATNTDLNSSHGYSKTTLTKSQGSQTKVTQTLIIARVSSADFEQQFECMGQGNYGEKVSFPVYLKSRQSVDSLVAAGVCVCLLSVLMAVTVKCFAIDLALLFRRFLPYRLGDSGVKMFDAYVVYQLHTKDKATEDSLCRFVSQDLPHILEDKCGYHLFIHGRDDLPGEDRLEMVEECVRKSRRLIVILTPSLASEVTETYHEPEGYDWQVGLHQALVQRDLSVILIQVGDLSPGGYTHLPPTLQHLIQKSAPIKWPQETQAARVNSRFWKRVRYLMPATPVRRCPQSTNI